LVLPIFLFFVSFWFHILFNGINFYDLQLELKEHGSLSIIFFYFRQQENVEPIEKILRFPPNRLVHKNVLNQFHDIFRTNS